MPILKFAVISAAALLLLVGGCRSGKGIYNVGAPVVTTKPNPSADEIAKAIIRAGVNANWRITEAGPGLLQGVRVERNHSATVNIDYSTKDYSITLKESTMEREGTVHRLYNIWVRELDIQIRSQLHAV